MGYASEALRVGVGEREHTPTPTHPHARSIIDAVGDGEREPALEFAEPCAESPSIFLASGHKHFCAS